MMLLGIVLHGAIGYMTLNPGVWQYQDPATTPVADLLVIGIHIFRMPVFFVVAGFFTALLVERRGVTSMLRNRFGRVMLPFALFWVILLPLTLIAGSYAVGMKTDGNGVAAASVFIAAGKFWIDNTVHLWFLYYLSLYYVMAWLAMPLVKQLPAGFSAARSSMFVRVMRSPFRALMFALPMAVVLWFQGGILQTALSFKPDVVVLLGYGLFFGFGWALWRHQDLMETLPRFAWTQILIAVLLIPVNLAMITSFSPGAPVDLTKLVIASGTGALIVWLLIFGITGIAIRFASHERPVMRYLTDGSYWMYLIHVPIMFYLQGLLSHAPLPALVKIMIVLAVATVVLVTSYHFLVRNTFMGAFLNGRRYPRELPRLSAAAEAVPAA
jgi:glucan biosynthesis protein C